MHGILSLTTLASVFATASCSIAPIPADTVREAMAAAPQAPAGPRIAGEDQPPSNAIFVPPWLLDLIISYAILLL